MDNLDKALIQAYGTQIEKELDIIKIKFAAVIAAHLYADTSGSDPLSELNSAIELAIDYNTP